MSFFTLVVALVFLATVAVVVGILTAVECKLRRLEEACKTIAPDLGVMVTLPTVVWRWRKEEIERILTTSRPRMGFCIGFKLTVRESGGGLVTILSEPV